MTSNKATDIQGQWLKITFFCPLELLDPASDLLGVLSGTGVEQSPENENGATISGFFQLGTPIDTLNQPPSTVDTILTEVASQLGDLFALYNQVMPQLTTTLLADEDWATSWQQYFKPFAIVPGLVIKPSWEEYQVQTGEQIIEMDPGMAFGTGQHASTRMALALIQESMGRIGASKALDVGTGTGILAMAAILFGAEQAVAIDNDPDAVRVARENIDQNRLGEKIAVSTTPVEQIHNTFPLVIANIVHDVLVEMAPTLSKLTASGGNLVLAGILSGTQEENIIRLYETLGYSLLNCQYQDEWVALQFQRNSM
ncbi:MAG: 50S ribosomal protein L11 methyltransferase [Desulfobulbus sp.]|nr:50S ribosomal protein L11 methyltransferase [Desulfobulbus sp.]